MVEENGDKNFRTVLRLVMLGIIGLFFLWLISSCIEVINPEEIGVPYYAMGGLQEYMLQAGWQFKIPIVQSIYHLRTSRRTVNMYYTTWAECEKDTECNDIAIQIPSKEGLPITVDVSVFYRIVPSKAPVIIKTLGMDYQAGTVIPLIRSTVRDVGGGMSVTELYGTGREKLESGIYDKLKLDFERDNLILEGVLVRDVGMPDSITRAIEDKQAQEQLALKKKYEVDVAEKEAERQVAEATGVANSQIARAMGEANSTVLKAQADADAMKLRAEGEATQIRLKGEAQAQAIELINKQLAQSPLYVQLKYAEQWDGKLPMYMIGSGALPLINIPTNQS